MLAASHEMLDNMCIRKVRVCLAQEPEMHKSFHGPVLLLSWFLMPASQAFLLFRKFHSRGFLADFKESLYEVSELISVLVFKLWSDGEKTNEERGSS